MLLAHIPCFCSNGTIQNTMNYWEATHAFEYGHDLFQFNFKRPRYHLLENNIDCSNDFFHHKTHIRYVYYKQFTTY